MPKQQPALLTAEQLQHVEKLAAGMTVEQIADFLGMSEATFYRRLKRDRAFLRAYKKGKANRLSRISGKLFQVAMKGNVTALIFIAKTQLGWRETDPRQLDVSDIGKLTEKELEREKRRMGIVR